MTIRLPWISRKQHERELLRARSYLTIKVRKYDRDLESTATAIAERVLETVDPDLLEPGVVGQVVTLMLPLLYNRDQRIRMEGRFNQGVLADWFHGGMQEPINTFGKWGTETVEAARLIRAAAVYARRAALKEAADIAHDVETGVVTTPHTVTEAILRHRYGTNEPIIDETEFQNTDEE